MVGGYTQVDFFADHNNGWPLSGEIDALHALAKGYWVSKRSNVELLLVPPIDLPMSEPLTTTAFIGERRILASRGPGQHVIEVLELASPFRMSRQARRCGSLPTRAGFSLIRSWRIG
ncbi:hypothetical protein JW805_20440 [Roseomonas aeriglobus]|nr:hypothetical protein [Roseomonas aeriglobus]